MTQTDKKASVPDCFLPAGLQAGEKPVLVHICQPDDLAKLQSGFTASQSEFLRGCGFTAKKDQIAWLPADNGRIDCVLFGIGNTRSNDRINERAAGALSARLGGGVYKFGHLPDGWDMDLACMFWGLGVYSFDKYKSKTKNTNKNNGDNNSDNDNNIARLVLGENFENIQNQLQACWLGRDLINTPAADMGPEDLQKQCQDLAGQYGADFTAIIGDELLIQNYPMIHAVGRAAEQKPRLLMLKWGDESHPSLALVGKGISFDTGGLDIKSAAGMRIMKKDMGGAAHALALAQMIMGAGLKIHLRVYLAVAENAVGGNAYRPGDILFSRKGISVEIDNTDAEGRLVLADALTKACEDEPKLLIDFATLTGAARIALGPSLPPFFCNREELTADIISACDKQCDNVWPMPLWGEYNTMLSSPIADMKNAGGSFAGAVTAALFLQRFVDERPWMHFDVYGWNPQTGPARPKGGEVFALRGLFYWLGQGGLDKL